jgi:hypothetical protein
MLKVATLILTDRKTSTNSVNVNRLKFSEMRSKMTGTDIQISTYVPIHYLFLTLTSRNCPLMKRM